MFHSLPFIQDRVFHVLVLTAHSQYILPGAGASGLNSQAHTVQLPINIKSFQSVEAVMQRSHVGRQANRYTIPDVIQTGGNAPTERQRKRKGNKLTQGSYVSVERLQPALHNDRPQKSENKMGWQPGDPCDVPNPTEDHVWDMMTISDAGGTVQVMPNIITRPQTLKAIAEDVFDVLQLIRKQREKRTER
jgi:hypothetical protein